MVRKGASHIIDAMVAIIVLLFFAVGTFNLGASNDWTEFENRIAANDLTYTLERTGHMDSFVSRGGTGSLKTVIESVSERGLTVSGEIDRQAPNMKVGFYFLPDELSTASLTRVESGDRCYSEIDKLQNESVAPILRTVGGPGSMESDHGDVRLYLGNYDEGESFVSQLEYDSVWVDNGTECDFPNSDDPYDIKETFYWGNNSGNGKVYEFRDVKVDSDTWNGTLVLTDGAQIQRFERTSRKKVEGIGTNVRIDSFNFSDSLDRYDILVFRGNRSIRRLNDTGRYDRVEQLAGEKEILFMADLNQSFVSDDELLHNLGFRWVDLSYDAEPEASCALSADNEIQTGCNLSIGFSGSSPSERTRNYVLGQETNLSHVSLYPEGSLTSAGKGAVSDRKIVYLKNYRYGHLSQDVENRSMEEVDSVSGNPSSVCGNVTEGEFSFPLRDGTEETLAVANTQLGTSSSVCSDNRRALNIDRNGDGDYLDQDEGPFLEGQNVDVNGIEYKVEIYPDSEPGCDIDDCAGLIFDQNAHIEVFNYASESGTGRTAYEEEFGGADRKALLSFMYKMAGANELSGSGEGFSNSIKGSTGELVYTANLRWSN